MTKYAAFNLLTRQWHVKVKTSTGSWVEVYRNGSRRIAFKRLAAV